MSTILDALRKLEEERQSRTTDVRSRLLLSSAYQTRPLRWQRPSWRTNTSLIGILSFALAGSATGVGVVFWRSYSTSPQSEQVSTFPSTNETHDQQTAVIASTQPSGQPPSEVTTPASVQLTPSSTETQATDRSAPPEQGNSDSTSTTTEASPPPSSSPTEEDNGAALPTTSAVQRSPFIASPSAARDSSLRSLAAPAAQSPPSSTSRRQQMASPSLPSTAQHSTTRATVPTALTPWDQYVQKSQQQVKREATANIPAGTSLSFLQWSNDPERRIAFLRINGGPLTMAHEGDTIGEYTVVEIRQNAVELQSGETKMTLRTP